MKSLVILVIMFTNSQPMIGLPLKKVFFPSDSEEIDEIFSFTDRNKTEKNEYIDTQSELQFRIDAAKLPCANSTINFCESISQKFYPSKYVKSVLQKSGDRYAEFFNKVELRDGFPEKINLCNTYKRISYPPAARNVHSDWRFIINTPEYRQQVQLQFCQKESSQCKFSKSFQTGYVSSCTQKYQTTTLLSIDYNGEISPDDFKFPSHCECELKKKREKHKSV